MKNYKGLMESMLYQGHGFLGRIKHFWIAVSVWKTNLVLEDLARQKRAKMWPKWGISWGLVDVWQSEWSIVWGIWIAKLSTKFWPSNWACRKFVPSWSQKFSTMNRRKPKFLAKKVISVVPQPTCSPDLSPCEFFLFPKFKFHLKGRDFGVVDNIKKVVTDQLRARLHEDFQHCYQEWEQCLRRYVASQGELLWKG